MIEKFRDIKWFEWLYQVSNLWNIKSLNYRRTWKEKLLKLNIDKDWYLQTSLWYLWDRKIYKVHRLVWLNFIKNIDNKPQINHKDWNKKNNNIENLEWVTQNENQKHRFTYLWQKIWNKWICSK